MHNRVAVVRPLLDKNIVSGAIVLLRRRSFDGGQNLLARWGIEIMAVEAEEEPFADVGHRGMWVLLPQGRLHEGARCRAWHRP